MKEKNKKLFQNHYKSNNTCGCRAIKTIFSMVVKKINSKRKKKRKTKRIACKHIKTKV